MVVVVDPVDWFNLPRSSAVSKLRLRPLIAALSETDIGEGGSSAGLAELMEEGKGLGLGEEDWEFDAVWLAHHVDQVDADIKGPEHSSALKAVDKVVEDLEARSTGAEYSSIPCVEGRPNSRAMLNSMPPIVG